MSRMNKKVMFRLMIFTYYSVDLDRRKINFLRNNRTEYTIKQLSVKEKLKLLNMYEKSFYNFTDKSKEKYMDEMNNIRELCSYTYRMERT